jgi:SAM-dependent methyltransferase
MKTRGKEEIRQAVRETYGKVAKAGGVASEIIQETPCRRPTDFSTEPTRVASCCGAVDISAETSPAESCGSGDPNLTLKQMSAIMGYSKENIDSVPDGANMGLGCGNPVALASLKPGETVVDLGSGGGFDCFLAAKEVGETGKVIGVDMTPDMVSKARKNGEKMGSSNVEFRLGEIENLPVADNSADIIMSNCVINLSPDKRSVYREAFRVLKPGGRLAISDVLATAPLPDEIRNDLALVGACVGGAATVDDAQELLQEVGFEGVRIRPKDNSQKLIREWDPGKNEKAFDYVVSAYIEAVKPS